jgi:signal peptidase I
MVKESEKEENKSNKLKNEDIENKSFLSDLKDFFSETVKIVVVSLVIIVGIRSFIMQPFFVSGKSMEPNFHNGDYLIVNEINYKFSDPERGDVIIFHYPKRQTEFFIKRIIGLPGEKIEIKNNRITVYNSDHPSGFTLDESEYIPLSTLTAGNYVIELKNDEYFVLGDNRMASADSRLWGPLEERFIVGRAWIRAWPFGDFAVFEGIEY